MTTNLDRAAEIITPWIEKEWGYPEDNAESAADALAAAGVLSPDVDPDRVHASGRITIIETGSDRTSVTVWGGVVTIVDEVAGDLSDHSPELAAENAMTIEEVDGMIAALTHARTIASHAQKEETNE